MRNTEFDRQRTVNNILSLLDATFLSPSVSALPQIVWFRVSTSCNVKCPLCPRQHLKPVDSGFMNYDRFLQVAPQLEGSERAGLFGLGEPLLHKRLFDFIEQGHAHGMLVTTSTNGMLLTEEVSRRFVESGLEELSISMDAATPELFNRLREGADFEKVCRNVRRLSELREAAGRKTPYLFLPCTVSTENVNEFHRMVALAKELGVDAVSFIDTIAVNDELAKYAVTNSDEFTKTLGLAQEKGEELGISVQHFRQKTRPWVYEPLEHEGASFGCGELWKVLTVERNGDTATCCYIWDEHGMNVFEHPVGEIVNTQERIDARRNLIEGRVRNECRGCPNLIENTPERVFGILEEAERQMSELEETDAARVRPALEGLKRSASERFGKEPPSAARELARKILPAGVRRIIKSALKW